MVSKGKYDGGGAGVAGGILVRSVDGHMVGQRSEDSYLDATAMCATKGKRWHEYWRLDATQELVGAIAENTGLDRNILVQTTRGRTGGTWIHPHLGIGLAMWLEPRFGAMVTAWVHEVMARRSADRISSGVAPEDVREIAAAAARETAAQMLAALPSQPAHPINAGPYWTLEDLLDDEGWTWHTKHDRAAIRKLAAGRIRRQLGQEVNHEDGGRDSRCIYYRWQVEIVQKAIRKVRAAAEERENRRPANLFSRPN